jgi:hypothetical protein
MSDRDRLRLLIQTIIMMDMTVSTPPKIPAAMVGAFVDLLFESVGSTEDVHALDGDDKAADEVDKADVDEAVKVGETAKSGLLDGDEKYAVPKRGLVLGSDC